MIGTEEDTSRLDPRHCDEYVDDPEAHPALRAFLERARMPAHGHLIDQPFPKLFATYNGPDWGDIANGDRVRVVLASRMGDVGVTKNFADGHGYSVRCAVSDLIEFGTEA